MCYLHLLLLNKLLRPRKTGRSLPTSSHSGQAATSDGTKLREQFWRHQQQYNIPAVSSKYDKTFHNESELREQAKALHCHASIFL
jgi:hypothetical protein